MTLPDGYTVRIGRHTRVVDDGAVLIGGAPARVARLAAAAQSRMTGREVVVTDSASRALAEYLDEMQEVIGYVVGRWICRRKVAVVSSNEGRLHANRCCAT